MAEAGFDGAIPVRRHDFEQHADGRVTVLVPKFSSRLARRLFMPLLAKPNIRMHLDDVGSLIWLACDGRTTVARLSESVRQRLKTEPETARERVYEFLRRLAREGSLTFQVPADQAGPPEGERTDAQRD
jgi:glycerol-3-phosphate O-acyltransferase